MDTQPSPLSSQPTPIVDVAPPPKAVAAQAESPKANDPPPTNHSKPAVPPQKVAKVSRTPTVVIFLAVLFFTLLSGLAYYAYTKAT